RRAAIRTTAVFNGLHGCDNPGRSVTKSTGSKSHPTGITIVNKNGRSLSIRMQHQRNPADIPPVSGRDQRHHTDHRVLRVMACTRETSSGQPSGHELFRRGSKPYGLDAEVACADA